MDSAVDVGFNGTSDVNSDAVSEFYTRHPYPPPVANLDRARAERHAGPPQRRGDVDEQRKADESDEIDRITVDLHAGEERCGRDDRHGQLQPAVAGA